MKLVASHTMPDDSWHLGLILSLESMSKAWTNLDVYQFQLMSKCTGFMLKYCILWLASNFFKIYDISQPGEKF